MGRASWTGLIVAALAACAPRQDPPVAVPAHPGPPWASPIGRDHPLAGRVYRPAYGDFIERKAVPAALAGVDFILLGEKHDNPDHHRIQAWLLKSLLGAGRRPAVAFEMFDSDQERRLASFLAARPASAAGLGRAVGWEKTGWPDWRLYQAIAQAALDGAAPILAASFPRKTIRAVVKDGYGVLGEDEMTALGLRRPLPPAAWAAMREEIVISHCRQLPEAMIDPMVAMQTAKDARMAVVLARGAGLSGRDGAVLIAGAGHVRTDHGVPLHLDRLALGKRVMTVGLIEVERDEMDPATYARKIGAAVLPFDLVWFTPRVDETDPCEAHADDLRRTRERHDGKTSFR
jgi:uncharacterized iron-regulated protein